MSEPQVPTKFASQQVQPEFLDGLEMVSNKIYDLPGAVFDRKGSRDARLGAGISVGLGDTNKVCYYEHVATIRQKSTGIFFVCFRETMDAILEQQKDPIKFPKWLMNDPKKDTERCVFIHVAKPNSAELIRTGRISTHQDWLDPITDEVAFNGVAYFLLKNRVIDEKMYRSIK